jgi:hypothetical protein
MEIERTLRRVVRRSFPELRRLRIGIAYEELGPGDLLQYSVLDGRWRIAASPLLRRAPLRVVEGGIAHELAHIVRDCRLGPAQRDLAFDRFAASRTYRVKEERATDRRAIERGYGPHLLALTRWARSVGIRFDGESGLRGWEIAGVA